MAFAVKQLGTKMSSIRAFHSTPLCAANEWKRFQFSREQFPKYGLYEDDVCRDLFPEVKEAISRLPEDVRMQRIYRTIRAQQLLIQHDILPKEEWTKFDDENNHYLKPYLEEVLREIKEREDWEKNH